MRPVREQETAKGAEMAARNERDKLRLQLEEVCREHGIEVHGVGEGSLVDGYLGSIQLLEAENQRLRTQLDVFTSVVSTFSGQFRAKGLFMANLGQKDILWPI